MKSLLLLAVLLLSALVMTATAARKEDKAKMCVARMQIQNVKAHVDALVVNWKETLDMLTQQADAASKERAKNDFDTLMADFGRAYINIQDELIKSDAKLKKMDELIESHTMIHNQFLQDINMEAILLSKSGKKQFDNFKKNWRALEANILKKKKKLQKGINKDKIKLANLTLAIKKAETEFRNIQMTSQVLEGEKEVLQELEQVDTMAFKQLAQDIRVFISKTATCPKTCFDRPCSKAKPMCMPKQPTKANTKMYQCKKIPTSCKKVQCDQGFTCKMMSMASGEINQLRDIQQSQQLTAAQQKQIKERLQQLKSVAKAPMCEMQEDPQMMQQQQQQQQIMQQQQQQQIMQQQQQQQQQQIMQQQQQQDQLMQQDMIDDDLEDEQEEMPKKKVTKKKVATTKSQETQDPMQDLMDMYTGF